VNDADCVRDIVGGNEGVEALDRQRAMMPPHCRKGNPRESHRQASDSSALPI
jgi:hypothetical protein